MSASPTTPAAPGSAAPASCVPSPYVMRLVNPVVSVLLRSRLHGPLGRHVLLLTLTGRKSGRAYTLPVGYVRDGGVLTVYSGIHRWWRNLIGGAPVALVLEGRRRTGWAETVVDPAALVAETEQLVERYGPEGASRRIGVALSTAPTRGELARAMAGHAVIRVTLDSDPI